MIGILRAAAVDRLLLPNKHFRDFSLSRATEILSILLIISTLGVTLKVTSSGGKGRLVVRPRVVVSAVCAPGLAGYTCS